MTTITVTIWHNVALDGQGHHTGMLEGYQPGDPVVRVFTYQANLAASPEQIAEEAFAICNGHPRDARGEDLARRYYERGLRSLSFPGNSPCERQTFSVHEVAHNHVEWVGGQGHYKLGYAAAIRLMAEKVVGRA